MCPIRRQNRTLFEVPIKDMKLYTRSDRTSCHRWEANQFRLFLHMGAYWHELRGAAPKPFLADAGSCPGNCSGMEEATGTPSSLADWGPKRLRASGRDGGKVMT